MSILDNQEKEAAKKRQIAASRRYGWPSLRGNAESLSVFPYHCGHCNKEVASDIGDDQINYGQGKIRSCPNCRKITFFDDNGVQYPGKLECAEISFLPVDVQSAYEEARRGMSVCNYTSVSHMCRKILMNVAVSYGAKPGLSFLQSIEHLVSNNQITSDMKKWVDKIRAIGNDAAHDVSPSTEIDARNSLIFTEMLLKTLYEFPNRT